MNQDPLQNTQGETIGRAQRFVGRSPRLQFGDILGLRWKIHSERIQHPEGYQNLMSRRLSIGCFGRIRMSLSHTFYPKVGNIHSSSHNFFRKVIWL
jgi:hypothetical protein